MRGNQFAVIADECVLAPFVDAAVDVLASDGVELESVERLKWKQTKNGRLHVKAHEYGADALLTFDKRMANQTRPRIPVLVFDDFYPSHTGLVLPVLADILAAREFAEPDYYPVMVDGFDPEPELVKIAAGLYEMNPRSEFEGRGYLKATWDPRDPRPPDIHEIEVKKRNAWFTRSGNDAAGEVPQHTDQSAE